MLALVIAAMLTVPIPLPPELGEPFKVTTVNCVVPVIAKQYRLSDKPYPEDGGDTVSLHLRHYLNWWALIVGKEPDEVHLWIDHDMDGKPDEYEVWDADEFFETYQSPCDLLDAILVV